MARTDLRLIEKHEGRRGTTYRVRFRDGGTRTGAPVTLTVRTLAEAVDLRDLVLLCGRRRPTDAQLVAHGFADLAAPAAAPDAAGTVADVCAAYLRHLGTRRTRRPAPNSMATYQAHLDLRIAPWRLGEIPAVDVTAMDVEEWQDELVTAGWAGKGWKASTVAAARTGLLGPAFRWATSPASTPLGIPLLDRANPVQYATSLEVEHFRRPFLESPAEYALAMWLAAGINARWAMRLLMQAATGVRIGEVCALRAEDLLPLRNTVVVRRHTVGGADLPGTKAGKVVERQVPVPAPLMAVLAGRTGRLFPSPTGGAWDSDSHLWRRLRTALADAGHPVHVTNHSLRHGLASWLASHGIAKVKVKLLLGHTLSKKDVTDGYTGHLTEIDRDMIRPLAAGLLGLT